MTLGLIIADVGENNLRRAGRGREELGNEVSATEGKPMRNFLGTDGHGFEKGTASCAMDKGFICIRAILKV